MEARLAGSLRDCNQRRGVPALARLDEQAGLDALGVAQGGGGDDRAEGLAFELFDQLPGVAGEDGDGVFERARVVAEGALELVVAVEDPGAAIEDQEYFRTVRAKILATRGRMAVELGNLGFEVTPSHANFLWCRRSDRPVKPIYEELKRRKILVRYMNYDGYDGLRISVGTDAEIDRLLAELKSIL